MLARRDHPARSRRTVPGRGRGPHGGDRQTAGRGTGPRRHRPDRRDRADAVRRPAHQPAPRPRRPLAAQLRRGLLHDRLGRTRGQRGGRGGAAADRPGAAALPLRRVLLRPRRPSGGRHRRHRPDRGRRPRRAARHGRLRDRADRRRPAQGVRQRRPRRSSRPPRPSPRTCRARSALAFAIERTPDGVRTGGRRERRGPPTPSWSARSATRRSTTPARPPRSTRPAGATTPACACRCCSSARTTAWASACARPRAGSRPRWGPGRGSATSRPTAATSPGRTTSLWRPPSCVRRQRRPAVLHLSTVRLMGHAGADAEIGYRTPAEIERDAAGDPVVAAARLLVEAGLATPDELLARYDEVGWQVRQIAEEVLGEPKLATAAEIVAPLAPRRPVRVARAVADAAGAGRRGRPRSTASCPRTAAPLTLAQTINATLADALLTHPRMVVFGEDVAVKGGVYGVTKGLRDRFGAARVFDTLLDETSILGLALGAGLGRHAAGAGDPVPGVPAQRRGPAARRGGHDAVLLARRVPQPDGACGSPGWPTRRGSAGTSTTTTRSPCCATSPALVLAVPARADDAAPMLRTCLAGGRGRRQRVRVPGADRALPHPRPVHRGRRGVAGPVPRARRPGPAPTCRSAGPGSIRCGSGRGPHDHHVRQRGTDVAAGRGPPGRGGDRRPRGRPALARAAAGRGHDPGGVGDRPGAGRRRDTPVRRGRRGRARRAGRRRIRRVCPSGRGRGLVRPARPGGASTFS